MDGHLHPGHALVLSMELDLGHAAKLGEHRGQIVLEVDDVADPMTGAHQQSGGRLLLILAWEKKKAELQVFEYDINIPNLSSFTLSDVILDDS